MTEPCACVGAKNLGVIEWYCKKHGYVNLPRISLIEDFNKKFQIPNQTKDEATGTGLKYLQALYETLMVTSWTHVTNGLGSEYLKFEMRGFDGRLPITCTLKVG